MAQLFSNNSSSTLNGAINDTVTSITLNDSSGMPVPSGVDYFLLTITNILAGTWEVVKVTDNAANVLTVIRGYEGTAQAWLDGELCQMNLTKDTMETLQSATGGDTLPITDATAVVKGSVDDTKLVRIEADGLTTSTTRVITMPDNDVDLGADFEPADGTILKDADIGVNVQAYDATIVVDADIGSTVQGYDVDTTKNDAANTFTLAQTFSEIITSAKGISFPATQVPSADANTLDDYEEGAFTATLTSGTGTITASSTLRYRKVGDLCFVWGKISVTAISSPTGTLEVTGLPFVTAAGAQNIAAGCVLYNTLAGSASRDWISLTSSAAAKLTIYEPTATSLANTADKVGASTDIYISTSYGVA